MKNIILFLSMLFVLSDYSIINAQGVISEENTDSISREARWVHNRARANYGVCIKDTSKDVIRCVKDYLKEVVKSKNIFNKYISLLEKRESEEGKQEFTLDEAKLYVASLEKVIQSIRRITEDPSSKERWEAAVRQDRETAALGNRLLNH